MQLLEYVKCVFTHLGWENENNFGNKSKKALVYAQHLHTKAVYLRVCT